MDHKISESARRAQSTRRGKEKNQLVTDAPQAGYVYEWSVYSAAKPIDDRRKKAKTGANVLTGTDHDPGTDDDPGTAALTNTDTEIQRYACSGCRKKKRDKKDDCAGKAPPVRWAIIRKKNEYYWSTVPEKNEHFCDPIKSCEHLAKDMCNNMLREASLDHKPLPVKDAIKKVETKLLDTMKDPEDLKSARTVIENRSAFSRRVERTATWGLPLFRQYQDLLEPAQTEIRHSLRSEKSGNGEERLLLHADHEKVIFATDSALRWLIRSTAMFADGTFKFSPTGTEQIYRVFAMHSDWSTGHFACVPVVTVLLKNKLKTTYADVWNKVFTRMCQLIQEEGMDLAVRYCLFDNEAGAWRSFLEEQLKYPALTILNPAQANPLQTGTDDAFPAPAIIAKMCLFHSQQGMFRKVQHLGMQTKYQLDEELQKFCRMISSLQHLNQDLWPLCLEILNERANNALKFPDAGDRNRLQQLLRYHSDTWLSLGDFYCLDGMPKDVPRTTNQAEGYHARQKDYYKKRLMLGPWTAIFREVDYAETMIREDWDAGRNVNQGWREDYKLVSKRIMEIKQELEAAKITGTGLNESLVDPAQSNAHFKPVLSTAMSRIGFMVTCHKSKRKIGLNGTEVKDSEDVQAGAGGEENGNASHTGTGNASNAGTDISAIPGTSSATGQFEGNLNRRISETGAILDGTQPDLSQVSPIAIMDELMDAKLLRKQKAAENIRQYAALLGKRKRTASANPAKRIKTSVVRNSSGQRLYEIAGIVGQRTFNGQAQYRVKWKGFEKATWENKDTLGLQEPVHILFDETGTDLSTGTDLGTGTDKENAGPANAFDPLDPQWLERQNRSEYYDELMKSLHAEDSSLMRDLQF